MFEEKEPKPPPPERPWIVLESTYDVEAWIDSYNRDLQAAVTKNYSTGHGICFRLEAGGELYLQTNGDGDIALDVTAEAAWIAPLISAATGAADPGKQLWALPGDRLVQLVFGLNGLIASTRIVLDHPFKQRRI